MSVAAIGIVRLSRRRTEGLSGLRDSRASGPPSAGVGDVFFAPDDAVSTAVDSTLVQPCEDLVRNDFGVRQFEHFESRCRWPGTGISTVKALSVSEFDQRFVLDHGVAHLLAPAQYGGAGSFPVGRD